MQGGGDELRGMGRDAVEVTGGNLTGRGKGDGGGGGRGRLGWDVGLKEGDY